ncbi:MAG: GNAT family N-acetyltransferase [Gammaproteobacteria bacterium]
MADDRDLKIRLLNEEDAALISAAFAAIARNKPVSQFESYAAEQAAGEREVLVAELAGRFVGYVTIRWHPTYVPFADSGIPEVQDFNVLPDFRRRGIGTRLMNRAEEMIAERSDTVGIGVGMYADYGNAQRLYVLRGYVPDGRGLTYKGQVLAPMESTINDDDLVLFFTKKLR